MKNLHIVVSIMKEFANETVRVAPFSDDRVNFVEKGVIFGLL